MATSRLIPLHQNKGKTISQCLSASIDYALNDNKTKEGAYISSYECDPKTAQAEFTLSKRLYRDITGRTQKGDVIAYQIRQSFKPGEITPEEANKIGYELAMSFTKGNHAFVVATHVDKAHIHSHIIFNSTTLDCTRKFRNFFRSAFAIRKISDRICLENGVSIIQIPKPSRGCYGKWLGDERLLSHSEKLRLTVDAVLEKKPSTFEQFLSLMQEEGYEIKRGKYIAFKSSEQQRFKRLRSLGKGYTDEEIKDFITGKIEHREKKVFQNKPKKEVNLLVDIQSSITQAKGKGYENWAKTFNLKQMAKTINYLREHDLLGYEDLSKKVNEITSDFDALNTKIKASEKRMAEIKVLQTHIYNYSKTREVYATYKKKNFSKKYYAEHESEILLHKAAKAHFNELNTSKLPTIKQLQTEYSELLTEKKAAYSTYKSTKKEMQDILTAKENVDRILGYKSNEKEKEKTQEQR